MPSTLNCSSRRRQSTWNTARLATRCSGFCGHRKISSDSSQMRHRSRTGSRAGKRNTPKVDFASAFGVLFCLYGDGSVPKERAACIQRMQFRKGLGISQQAFLRGAGRTRSKNGVVVPRGPACYNCVGSRKLTASELCRCPNLSYNEDVLRERRLA